MTRRHYQVLLLAAVLLITACSHTADASTGTDAGSEADHMHPNVPAEFADLVNPFAENEKAIVAGAETYKILCATCHGPEGKGDGPGAAALDPKPADLSDGMMMGEMSDGYLFWRVSKGGVGEPFNSAMPPWENVLAEEQRWNVISYIRSLSEGSQMDDGHMGNNHDN
jgi:mono/diheme cytochrome c family protein